MAGFLDSNPLSGIRSRLTDLSRFGMKYDDLLVKNSQAIGFIEGQLSGMQGGLLGDDLMKATLALSDTTSSLRSKSIAFLSIRLRLKERTTS